MQDIHAQTVAIAEVMGNVEKISDAMCAEARDECERQRREILAAQPSNMLRLVKGIVKERDTKIDWVTDTQVQYIRETKRLSEINAKRRFDAYWEAHQEERAALESEDKSLRAQIADINNEIPQIPQNTEGYAHMIELQKRVQSLTADKKEFSLFKKDERKERKTLKDQIKTLNVEIAPIQVRIDVAIKAAQDQMAIREARIQEIYSELTMPR